jgi:hypothetical protein
MDENVIIKIHPTGIVEKVKEITLKSTTISDFIKEMNNASGKPIVTPILPRNSICYSRHVSGSTVREFVTCFFPSSRVTISYRGTNQELTEDNIRNYEIAMPHLLLRQQFVNGRVSDMVSGVVKSQPEQMQDNVYLLDMPNIYDCGKVCITLEGTPGDIVSSCQRNIDLFFGQSPFSNDLVRWPPGVRNFPDWAMRTSYNSRFILDAEWRYMCKLSDFVNGIKT